MRIFNQLQYNFHFHLFPRLIKNIIHLTVLVAFVGWPTQLGSVSYNMSFALWLSESGNLMSKLTRMSPFLLASLGWGSPWPWSLLVVVGLTISLVRLMGIFSVPNVGTSITQPQSACKQNTRNSLMHLHDLIFFSKLLMTKGLSKASSEIPCFYILKKYFSWVKSTDKIYSVTTKTISVTQD